MDRVETTFYGFKPFQHPYPNEADANARSQYFLLNSLRLDEGSPLYGDLSLVLLPSFAHRASVISPFDTGSHCGFCEHCFDMPNSFHHNCSSSPGHAGLGTFEAFDHLFGINEAFWATSEAFLQPLGRLFGSVTLTGADLLRYFEVMPTAQVQFPKHVKLVIASIPSLFGTLKGEQVRLWCERHGWPLVWSLGLNLDYPADQGKSHFWDILHEEGPFQSNHRLLDPKLLESSGLMTPGYHRSGIESEVFEDTWRTIKSIRLDARLPPIPEDFQHLWKVLVQRLPDLQIEPAGTFCPDLDHCVGVTKHGCVCKVEASMYSASFAVSRYLYLASFLCLAGLWL